MILPRCGHLPTALTAHGGATGPCRGRCGGNELRVRRGGADRPGSVAELREQLRTGGAGYVGSVVAQHLLEAGHTVTVLDDLST
ncbi:NAD-dependent epimerase/dehydratase family protein, partial [Oerskovia enterophila]